ncbi:LAMI_0G14136g1_1 [Lachancea mirantina]|uniref:LAMI_0G14136g1_1 n=1 Tax=Lachancea mirantina TaxID=1230905 RepID=A0A1G4KC02_9SACH|nr:LAMI_0G14136g1_1 [Lachancea mirantina]
MEYYVPKWWLQLCVLSSFLSVVISSISICRQLINYRKPSEQRLIVRIQVMVPLFSVTCLLACFKPQWAQTWTEPIREIYEAFVIYTFFSLLTLILGGERRIITELCMGKAAVRHPICFIGAVLPRVDMSSPSDFLAVKRGILQYVWFKPVYCLAMTFSYKYGWNHRVWIVLYNISATLSLYDLALFWKCLYKELQQYHPWPKFLCVKLIIFASYWQGMVISILSYYGVIEQSADVDYGYVYQNAMLCVEMIGFAVGHLIAFNWEPYSARSLPGAARLTFGYALRDWLGFGDLIWDFKTTFRGDDYTHRNFDSAEAVLAMQNMRTRMHMLNEGLRFSEGGRERYWITNNRGRPSQVTYGTTNEEDPWTEFLGDVRGYIPEDPNYPIIWDVDAYKHTRSMARLRGNLETPQSV